MGLPSYAPGSGRSAATLTHTLRPGETVPGQGSPAYLPCHRLSPWFLSSPSSAVFSSALACRFPACWYLFSRYPPEVRAVGCAFAHSDRNSITGRFFFGVYYLFFFFLLYVGGSPATVIGAQRLLLYQLISQVCKKHPIVVKLPLCSRNSFLYLYWDHLMSEVTWEEIWNLPSKGLIIGQIA